MMLPAGVSAASAATTAGAGASAPLMAAMGPIGWTALGAQAISMGVDYFAGQDAKKKAKQQAKADAELARHAAEVQINTILDQKTEAEKKAVQNMSLMARESAMQRGRILAGAGEAGIAGGSVSSSLLASYQSEAEARGNELYNLDAYRRQSARQIEAAKAGLAANMPRYEGSTPSGFATVLSGATQLLSSYYNITKR